MKEGDRGREWEGKFIYLMKGQETEKRLGRGNLTSIV